MGKITNIPSIDKTHLKSESFFDRHPIIPNISIYNSLKFISSKYKNDSAIDCLDLNMTYQELMNDAVIISKSLKELGVKKGDIIAIAMPNLSQAVASFLAANRIGAVVTFLNHFSSIEEINHYLNVFESRLFINYDKTRDYNEKIMENSKVEYIVTLNKDCLNGKGFGLEQSGSIGYDNILNFNSLGTISKYYNKPFRTLYGSGNDALVLFTSGTTGNPKAVVLTNKNILASGIYMKNSTNIKVNPGEKCLVCVPFCYPYGFTTSLLMTLLCGREAVLAPTLSKDTINDYLKKNINIVFGSPALLELMMKNVDENLDLSAMNTFISGGDFLTVSKSEEGKQFFRQHNADVAMCNGSGNAETTATASTAVGVLNRPETVGKILVGSSAIVIDENTKEELEYGQEGLLCISGAHVFKEYYKEPKLTAEAKFKYRGKTYFKTGTRGFLEKDGYFTLTGRDARFYITSTLNKVYCDRIQLVMSCIDVIDSVAVVKKPDDENLYTGKAFIVLKDGVLADDLTKDYIKDMCYCELSLGQGEEKNQLKPYEVPTSFEFVDSLPHHAFSDKIDYGPLEENAKREYEKERKILKEKSYQKKK